MLDTYKNKQDGTEKKVAKIMKFEDPRKKKASSVEPGNKVLYQDLHSSLETPNRMPFCQVHIQII